MEGSAPSYGRGFLLFAGTMGREAHDNLAALLLAETARLAGNFVAIGGRAYSNLAPFRRGQIGDASAIGVKLFRPFALLGRAAFQLNRQDSGNRTNREAGNLGAGERVRFGQSVGG